MLKTLFQTRLCWLHSIDIWLLLSTAIYIYQNVNTNATFCSNNKHTKWLLIFGTNVGIEPQILVPLRKRWQKWNGHELCVESLWALARTNNVPTLKPSFQGLVSILLVWAEVIFFHNSLLKTDGFGVA